MPKLFEQLPNERTVASEMGMRDGGAAGLGRKLKALVTGIPSPLWVTNEEDG